MKASRCKNLLKKLSEYIDAELDPVLRRRIDAHMADCRPCRIFIRSLKKTVELLHKKRSSGVPSSLKRRLRLRLP